MLEVGTKAPAFTLPDQDGEMRSLSDYQGQKVILYFYPKDLAAHRGTYRLITETSEAIRLMFTVLQSANVSRINILLDEPVSNSGRLKARIADIAEEFSFDLDIQILREVDRELYDRKNVITSDSVILDHCLSWINLMAECLALKNARAIRVW